MDNDGNCQNQEPSAHLNINDSDVLRLPLCIETEHQEGLKISEERAPNDNGAEENEDANVDGNEELRGDPGLNELDLGITTDDDPIIEESDYEILKEIIKKSLEADTAHSN